MKGSMKGILSSGTQGIRVLSHSTSWYLKDKLFLVFKLKLLHP